MKKSILISFAVLTTFSLMAFAFVNLSNTATVQKESPSCNTVFFDNDFLNNIYKPITVDFFYDVASRYMTTFTKEDLNKVKSMSDFLPKEQIESIVSFRSVSITFLDNDYKSIVKEAGNSEIFNVAQIKLLRSADYSTDILIRAEYQEKNKETGELEYSYTTPHITIVPEKEAEYINGKDVLIKYLKENSKVQTAIVKQDKLQPGKVRFTVTRKGTISNVKLFATSGYPSIDKTMVELITKTTGDWESATNSKGEIVDQELVFSFGIIGC